MSESTAPLSGQCVLVTGGAKRVGAAIARELHGAGANLVVHYRGSAESAQKLAAELESRRAGSITTVATDLLDVAALPALVDAALARFGRLDVLVNNASSFYPTPVGTITPAQWEDLLGTNLRAPLFLAQAAAPALRSAQGSILNLIDIHALRPLRRHPVYCAAKAGLAMLTRSLARELGPEVRVNGIAPGPVLWPETGIDERLKAEIVDRTALKRVGSPEDVARTALYLTAHAPYVTGQIIAVDGGRSI
jgi:pteridine reductase